MARDKVVRDVVIEEMAAEGKALARIGEVRFPIARSALSDSGQYAGASYWSPADA